MRYSLQVKHCLRCVRVSLVLLDALTIESRTGAGGMGA
jgi:hypothetical protein